MKRLWSFGKSIALAIGTGFFVAILTLYFNAAVDGGAQLFQVFLERVPPLRFFMPLMGGALTFLLYALYLNKDHTGIGVVQVLVELEKVKTHLMKPFRVLVRVIGAAVTLIFGFSAGRFAPLFTSAQQ